MKCPARTRVDETQVQRIDKATKLLEVCDEKLADLLARTSTMMGRLTPNDVAVWKQEEQRQLESTRKSKAEKDEQPWEESYVCILKNFHRLRQQQQNSEDAEEIHLISKKCLGLDQQLKVVETKRKLERWKPGDAAYIQAELGYEIRCKRPMLMKLQGQARELQYLISLRKKYADGQAVAQRISRQVRNTCNLLRKACVVYNNKNFSSNASEMPNQVEFDNVSHPEREVYQTLTAAAAQTTAVPHQVQREAIELFCLRQRATEEIQQVPIEMMAIVNYYHGLHQSVMLKLASITGDTPDQVGLKSLLIREGNSIAVKLQTFVKVFHSHAPDVATIQLPVPVNLNSDNGSPDSVSNDNDNEFKERIDTLRDTYELDEDSDCEEVNTTE